MNTYEIETTNGLTIKVGGDHFGASTDERTGEFYGWEVTKDGKLVSFVAPSAFLSVVVKA